jgi:hypothetical protein
MKLEEMADVLEGLATTLEKFLGKTAVSDFHSLSACLRKFSGETVAAFCNFTVQARDGKAPGRRSTSSANGAKVEELVGKIRHFLDHRQDYDYPAIRQLVSEVAKLKVPEIRAIGDRIECPLTERTKAAMVSSLENWLTNIKLSAEQSSFTLTGAGT